MNPTHMQIDEDEIDLKEIVRTLYRYRYMILLLVILFTVVSTYYAYFQSNIYKASATVEVGLDRRASGGQDVLAMAMDSGTMNAATEMEIIKSRFLTEKALKEVNFSHKYYTTRRFKEIELYKDSPLQVVMRKGDGRAWE